jgi:hypothetical protein
MSADVPAGPSSDHAGFPITAQTGPQPPIGSQYAQSSSTTAANTRSFYLGRPTDGSLTSSHRTRGYSPYIPQINHREHTASYTPKLGLPGTSRTNNGATFDLDNWQTLQDLLGDGEIDEDGLRLGSRNRSMPVFGSSLRGLFSSPTIRGNEGRGQTTTKAASTAENQVEGSNGTLPEQLLTSSPPSMDAGLRLAEENGLQSESNIQRDEGHRTRLHSSSLPNTRTQSPGSKSSQQCEWLMCN